MADADSPALEMGTRNAMSAGLTRLSMATAGNANRIKMNRLLGRNAAGDTVIDVRTLDRELTVLGGLIPIAGGPIRGRACEGGPTVIGGGIIHAMINEISHSAQAANNVASAAGSTPVFCRVDGGAAGVGGKLNAVMVLPSAGMELRGLCFYGRRLTSNNNYNSNSNRCDFGLVLDDEVVSGVLTTKGFFENLSFHQFRNSAIYIPYLVAGAQGDSQFFGGIHAISNYLDTLESDYSSEWSWFRSDSPQSLGHTFCCELTVGSNTCDFAVFNLAEVVLDGSSNQYTASGGINFAGSILFNRSGTVLKVGKTPYSVGEHKFAYIKYDAGLDNQARAVFVDMRHAEAELYASCTSFNMPLVSRGLYRRPLNYPLGNSYFIEIRDATHKLHQVDLDAWPVGGVRSTDTCMSVVPTGSTAHYNFGLPATCGTPAESALVQDINDNGANNHDLTQATAGFQATYHYDQVHHRPGLTFDGSRYYAKASAAGLGPGATFWQMDWSGRPNTNGANILSLCSVSANNNVCIIVAIDADTGTASDNFPYMQISSNGSVAGIIKHTSTTRCLINQPTHIRATFIGGTGGTGIMDLMVNGKTTRLYHSQAALFNATAPFLLGAQEFNAGGITRKFVGDMYSCTITVGSAPSAAELAIRRDMIASQIGAPIDVYVPQLISAAPNTSSPTIITSNSHGLNNRYWDGFTWAAAGANRLVTITGALGNTAINGTWPVTVLSPNTFSIPVAGNGTYTANSATLTAI